MFGRRRLLCGAPLRCEPLAVDNVRAHPSPLKDEYGLARTTCLPHWRSPFLEQHLRCYFDWYILWPCVRTSSPSAVGLELISCYSLFGLSIHQAYRYYRLDFGNGDSVGMKLYVRDRTLGPKTPLLIASLRLLRWRLFCTFSRQRSGPSL